MAFGLRGRRRSASRGECVVRLLHHAGNSADGQTRPAQHAEGLRSPCRGRERQQPATLWTHHQRRADGLTHGEHATRTPTLPAPANPPQQLPRNESEEKKTSSPFPNPYRWDTANPTKRLRLLAPACVPAGAPPLYLPRQTALWPLRRKKEARRPLTGPRPSSLPGWLLLRNAAPPFPPSLALET